MYLSRFLDRLSDDKLERASRYLEAGQIEIVDLDATSNKLDALVGGSRPHRTSITIDPATAELSGASCSCRKGTVRRPCPHITAVAMLTEESFAHLAAKDTERTAPARSTDDQQDIATAEAIVKNRADMEALQRYIAATEFASPEALDEFLSGIVGRDIREVLDELRGDAPLPPAEAALRLLADAGQVTDAARRRAIAEEALAIDPDCVQAMLERALAQETQEDQLAELARVERRAGELLDEDLVAEHAGRLYDFVHARPYLRALALLADASLEAGDDSSARRHYERLLQLDADDHSQARHTLIVLYVAERDFLAVKRLYREYPGDPFAVWHYARAIAAYRELGDTAAARKYRRLAVEANPDVVLLAAHAIPYPPRTHSYALGSLEEAAWALETLHPITDPRGGLDAWFDRGLAKFV